MSLPDRLRAADWPSLAWGAQGLTHLALRSAAEVTELVTEMHGTINQFPLPTGAVTQSPRRAAPGPYRLVSGVFHHAARLLIRWPLAGEVDPAHPLALPLLAAANGVFG